MNFTFNVNHFLKEEITKVDNRLQPCRQNGSNRYGFQSLQRMLYEVVDKMGEASAKAQNLPGNITTGKKLETANQRLYIMKDASSGDHSSVVGILKVGTKKLFVYDTSKIQHELDPLCVLDFYVHESRQREGCGRKLFEFMLRSEGIRIEHLAVDRPSPKFMAFLKKHYNLHAVIPQVNNFVIFDGFFNGRGDAGRSRKPGANYHKTNHSPWNPFRPPSGKRSATPSEQIQQQFREVDNVSSKLASTTANQPHHLGAGEVMYSRHRSTPPYNRTTPPPPTPPNGYLQGNGHLTANNFPSPHVNSNYYLNNNWNKATSPHMYFAMGTNPSSFINSSDITPNNPLVYQRTGRITPQGNEASTFSKGPANTPNFGARFGRESDTLFPDSNNRARSTTIQGERVQDSKQNPVLLPDIHNGNLKGPSHPSFSGQNPQSEILAHRPPSGKKGVSTNAKDNVSNPPLLQREGPPQEYKMMMTNNDCPVKNASSPFEKSASPQQPASVMPTNGYHATAAKPPYAAIATPYSYSPQRDTSWTVSGALREQRLNANVQRDPSWTVSGALREQRLNANVQRDPSWTVSGVLTEQRLNANVNSWYNPRRLW